MHETLGALNDLYTHGGAGLTEDESRGVSCLSAAQHGIHEHVRESIETLGPCPEGLTTGEALRKLHVSSWYDESEGQLGRYSLACIALPPAGTRPVPLASLWGPGGHAKVADFVRRSCLDETQARLRKKGARVWHIHTQIRR